ncbi:hypothetical protein DFH29DRAFT_881137 [Suillus ampliporus]|nr:hypothetical protein DFH29DRAFT_881137 [Suillus ampliporus]
MTLFGSASISSIMSFLGLCQVLGASDSEGACESGGSGPVLGFFFRGILIFETVAGFVAFWAMLTLLGAVFLRGVRGLSRGATCPHLIEKEHYHPLYYQQLEH